MIIINRFTSWWGIRHSGFFFAVVWWFDFWIFRYWSRMKPYNTIEDVSITEKSPKEAMALLPIWLLTMLELLWEKKWVVESDWIIIIFHVSLFAMISGGFVSFCTGLTTEYDGIDVFIGRPAESYISRSPVVNRYLLDLESSVGDCHIGETKHEVLYPAIDGQDQGVRVRLPHYFILLWLTLLLANHSGEAQCSME